MGYQKADGRWADTEPVTLQASAAKTATGTSTAFESGGHGTARLTLANTAIAGTSTPTLTVTVQTSTDGATWYTSGVFTAVTTGSTSEQKLFIVDRFVRLSYVISGTTPSFTFSVAGELAA